ncbi:MAG TPA: transcriptional regulator NrdR [Planctomycetaceae bacterium]|nr:transcriptional regulator NrdR [Planctomycetaceae bacterium]
MRCPACRGGETKVVDSRISHSSEIRRRRECLDCGKRFTTYERIEKAPLNVVKKDGTRVPFERDKIRAGLEKACYKRSVSTEQIEAILTSIEQEMDEEFDREVHSRFIGEKVCEYLKEVDKVAFVRFASVYREFKDVNDFVEELGTMLKERNT